MANTLSNGAVRRRRREGPSLRSGSGRNAECPHGSAGVLGKVPRLCSGRLRSHGCAGVLGGFTFIELLATVVFLGIIMPVAMESIGLCTRLGGQSGRQIEAASLARSKLTELTSSGDWSTGEKSGDFGMDWPGYRWTAAVSGWTDSVVSRLDVTVTWQSQGRERSVTFSTLIYSENS